MPTQLRSHTSILSAEAVAKMPLSRIVGNIYDGNILTDVDTRQRLAAAYIIGANKYPDMHDPVPMTLEQRTTLKADLSSDLARQALKANGLADGILDEYFPLVTRTENSVGGTSPSKGIIIRRTAGVLFLTSTIGATLAQTAAAAPNKNESGAESRQQVISAPVVPNATTSRKVTKTVVANTGKPETSTQSPAPTSTVDRAPNATAQPTSPTVANEKPSSRPQAESTTSSAREEAPNPTSATTGQTPSAATRATQANTARNNGDVATSVTIERQQIRTTAQSNTAADTAPTTSSAADSPGVVKRSPGIELEANPAPKGAVVDASTTNEESLSRRESSVGVDASMPANPEGRQASETTPTPTTETTSKSSSHTRRIVISAPDQKEALRSTASDTTTPIETDPPTIIDSIINSGIYNRTGVSDPAVYSETADALRRSIDPEAKPTEPQPASGRLLTVTKEVTAPKVPKKAGIDAIFSIATNAFGGGTTAEAPIVINTPPAEAIVEAIKDAAATKPAGTKTASEVLVDKLSQSAKGAGPGPDAPVPAPQAPEQQTAPTEPAPTPEPAPAPSKEINNTGNLSTKRLDKSDRSYDTYKVIIEKLNANPILVRSYVEIAKDNNMSWEVLAAIHYRETNFSLTNPANKQGIFQFYADRNTNKHPPGKVLNEEEFKQELRGLIEFLEGKCGGDISALTLSNPDAVMNTFLKYNGTGGSVYKNQKESPDAALYTGSPYVVNMMDDRTDSRKNPNWKQFRSDGGNVGPANHVPGAWPIAQMLSKNQKIEIVTPTPAVVAPAPEVVKIVDEKAMALQQLSNKELVRFVKSYKRIPETMQISQEDAERISKYYGVELVGLVDGYVNGKKFPFLAAKIPDRFARGENVTSIHSIGAFVGAFQELHDVHGLKHILAGGGFRTNQRQGELRGINGCPDLDVSPASTCNVPTARRGFGMHQNPIGAVDVYNERTDNYLHSGKEKNRAGKIKYKKDKEWDKVNEVMVAHGLKNLPTEGWHFSGNGH